MNQPLAGVVVTELSHALAGPHAAMMLGDLGARVIKVEPPGGDDSRGWGPPFVGPPGSRESTYFLSCNRNKESIVLDLKTEKDHRTLERLVERSDVLVENFRTGALDRLGFSVERLHELNPRLIVLSITGFGPDGPEGGRAGYDQIVQGEAGLMSLTGNSASEPTRVGVPIADLLAGINGALGVVSALFERERTGVGRVVRTSLLASIVGVHAYQGTRYTVAGEVPRANGNQHQSIAPYGLFHSDDGPVQIAVGSEALWRVFGTAFGIDPDDPRFATNADRVVHSKELSLVINRALAGYSSDRALALLDEIGVPAGRIRTLDEVYGWPQVHSQHLLVEVDHPSVGRIGLPGSPLRLDGGQDTPNRPPPTLGADTVAVRRWLGEMSDSDPHRTSA